MPQDLVGHRPGSDAEDSDMPTIGLGIQLWAQNTDWASYLAAARLVDELGYDHLWTWDHLLSAVGDPGRPVFEGYTTLAAWAAVTSRTRLGLLVGANTFRNPAIVAKMIATIDHISGGRAILGLGGGWHEREHAAFGIEFGRGFGDRLDWLEEALAVVRPLMAGEEVTHAGPRYAVERLSLLPPPVQSRVPIMVGGVGEKKTLRSVARHADIWNAQLELDEAPHKMAVLRAHCEAEGRDPAEIEMTYNCKIVIRDRAADARAVLDRQLVANTLDPAAADESFWAGTVESVAERLAAFVDAGFSGFTIEQLAPFDEETLVRLATEVKPLVERR
jgi:alkanesulfonate monooxygenase SsuD/methylene tetrahydromethanopterin reductase-like flavin-dependent oxidoreductase (luciferase family)